MAMTGVALAAESEPVPAPASVIRPQTPTPPKAAIDRRNSLRAGLNTRGNDTPRVGLTLTGEIMSPVRKRLDVGLGLELLFLQAQNDSDVLSFLPVFWVGHYHPLARYRPAYLTARLGFDLLGQSGNDTLAERNYYGVGIGLIPHPDRPRSLQWEVLYSRMRGSYPGIAVSAGVRF